MEKSMFSLLSATILPGLFLILTVVAVICIVVVCCRCKDVEPQKGDAGKGDVGEKCVADILKPLGTVFNDYILVDENGKSHQIDHILVNAKGVFVVETKNYSGRIYGHENQQQWKQVIRYSKRYHYRNHRTRTFTHKSEEQFYNPVKQNKTHAFHISKVLPKGTRLYQCVVFVQNNIDYIHSDNVFTCRGLKEYIESRENIYNEEKIAELCVALTNHRSTIITNEQHIQNIQKTLSDIDNGICPRCGGNLVLRKGQYGEFYGCSNYPDCKFTKKL